MSDVLKKRVELVEVGPRDGLQNDPADLDTATKVALITRLMGAGMRRLEVASFVSREKVPKMADAEAVVEALPDVPGAGYIGLVLNRRGLERALQTRLREVNFVIVASDTFSLRNQGMGTEDSMIQVSGMVPEAAAAGVRPTVTIAAAFGCPYEGLVPVDRVVEIAGRAAAAGVAEVALADTIGVAVPRDVTVRLAAVAHALGNLPLRAHFHNTRNSGYANALAAVAAGVGALDASLGGIGGCPFAPRATGNIATEDLAWILAREGVDTGVDLEALLATGAWLEERLGRTTPGLVGKAGIFPPV